MATDRTTYQPGTQGIVTLRNQGSSPLRFNLYPRQLEQQLGDSWFVRDRLPGPGELSTAEAGLLEPEGVRRTAFRLPRGLTLGTYRWRFFAIGELTGARGERVTNSFRVEG